MPGGAQAGVRLFWWCVAVSRRECESFPSYPPKTVGYLWESSRRSRSSLRACRYCWCWYSFCQVNIQPWRWRPLDIFMLWTSFSCWSSRWGMPLPLHLGCCQINCQWRCCPPSYNFGQNLLRQSDILGTPTTYPNVPLKWHPFPSPQNQCCLILVGNIL